MRLTEIIQEHKIDFSTHKDLLYNKPDWPSRGQIDFADVSLRYRPTTELVLDSLTFSVQPGQKVGIVGRTGAGKSTICLSISRIVELFGGCIHIDGIDIAKLDLHELRRRITVIPQDPTIFKGSVRFNLDPMQVHPDSTILQLLDDAQLSSLISGNGLDF